MAEHKPRAPRSANRGEPASARGGRHHDALQRRATARGAGYDALLNSRRAGPRPIQRQIVSSVRSIEGPKEIASHDLPAGSQPIQMAMHYGNTTTLNGQNGQVHWHYSFDDTDHTSLHLTIADTQNYANRTWASRRSYTPTAVAAGNWGGWVNNHGQTPNWATTLVGNRGIGTAATAFRANNAVAVLLQAAFPPPAVNINNLAQFPALPQRQAPAQPPPQQVQPQPVQAPAPRRLNANAPAYVPRGQ